MSDNVLTRISPQFRPYLEHLLRDLKLGLCKAKVDVETTYSKFDSPSGQFCLVLPYCSKRLKWEVIFNEEAPWFAPDFRLDEDDFLGALDAENISKLLPNLANWNDKDPKALTLLIAQMVDVFKNYMLDKLKSKQSSRAYFEYSALLGQVNESDIEVWMKEQSAEFLIKLDIDTSELPEIYNGEIDENPSEDSAFLLWRYPHSTNPELILSPNISRIIGQCSLPPMHHSGVLIDYVPTITELLNNKIQTVLNNEKMKRELLSQLVVKYNGAILEHDDSSASFLFEVDDFHWILQVEMGLTFPDPPATMTLISVYYQSLGRPRSKVLSPYSYQNIPVFESYIQQQLDIFKSECMLMTRPSTSSMNDC